MRIVHYINQFFGGIGGEERADTPPEARAGAVGPGRALRQALGAAAEIAGTVICGVSGLPSEVTSEPVASSLKAPARV